MQVWCAGVMVTAMGGCAGASRQTATTVAPTNEELPSFNRMERNIPAKVDVEHLEGPPRAPLVVLPNLAAPTAEERAKLGLSQKTEKDRTVAAFYRPSTGVSKGVQPFDDRPRYELGTPDPARYGLSGERVANGNDPFSQGGGRVMISDLPNTKYMMQFTNEYWYGQTMYPYFPGVGLDNPRLGATREAFAHYR